MKIKYLCYGTEFTVPCSSELAKYACQTYGFLLNCSEHRFKEFNEKQFAAIIRETYDCNEPRNKAICEELERIN